MLADPEVHPPADTHNGVLVWRWPSAVAALSSAPVGGGVTHPHWVTNIGVASDYCRTDLADHVDEVAAQRGLVGSGIGLFTAAAVDRVRRAECHGAAADVTVGVTKPTWAADPDDGWNDWRPGTINIVAQIPAALEAGAAVNAVITITEAKSQALREAGVPGTGTASDAVVVVWAVDGPQERFGGPRSPWGARIAQATHAAVYAGLGAGA
ncbi:adenosylcobinamide amidohydrolase [soil metagenome]